MVIEEMLKHLKYSKCNCEVDYKKDLGIINGQCPVHAKSMLLVDGLRVEAFIKLKKLDRKASEIV